MVALAQPAARRLTRPSWRDGRLVAGVTLVLLATALGAWGLRAADTRTAMYAAREVLLPGQALSPDRLERVDVHLSGSRASYLAAADPLPADGYVLREVRPGELIPRSAVGRAADIAVQPLVVTVDAASANTLITGSSVDVYANRPTKATSGVAWEGPQRILAAVLVGRVATGGVGLGSGGARATVQLLVPTDTIPKVIDLVDAGSKMTLVPVPGSALRSTS